MPDIILCIIIAVVFVVFIISIAIKDWGITWRFFCLGVVLIFWLAAAINNTKPNYEYFDLLERQKGNGIEQYCTDKNDKYIYITAKNGLYYPDYQKYKVRKTFYKKQFKYLIYVSLIKSTRYRIIERNK